MILSGLALGAVLGIVMQRGRFCVTGFLRDIFLLKSWRTFTALLIVISVHAVGLTALSSAGVISPEVSNFAPVAVIVGGFLFGIGIVWAGGCASGTWYRTGEGLVGSWFALIFYALFAAAMKYGFLNRLDESVKSFRVEATTIPETLGVSPWIFTIALSALTAYLTWHYMSKEKRAGLRVANLGKKGLAKPLHVYTAAVLVGLLGVAAWPLSAATGRNSGLGITTPSADIASFLTTGEPERINWGVMLVLGILIGSFIAAKSTGEFRIRIPDATQTVRSIGGGALMGIGAALAGGCTVGNGMVQTSLFSYQGWVSLLFMALGVGFAAKIWLKPSRGSQPASAPDAAPQAQPLNTAASPVTQAAPSLGGTAVATLPQVDLGLKVARKPGLTQLEQGRYHLDSMGAVCPFPLIEAKDALEQLEVGDELTIEFDCTQGTETIPRWAADNGHEVVDFQETGDAGWIISIVKR